MKKKYEKELSLDELAARPDAEIDTSDIPALGDGFFQKARLMMPEEWERRSLIPFDRDIVDWFKAQGKGHETRMNAILRAYMDAHRD